MTRCTAGEKPDAGDPADRAAVDAVFENLAEDIAEHPPEDRASIEDDYVRRTGMLPAALRDTLIGGMLSPQLSVILLSPPPSRLCGRSRFGVAKARSLLLNHLSFLPASPFLFLFLPF